MPLFALILYAVVSEYPSSVGDLMLPFTLSLLLLWLCGRGNSGPMLNFVRALNKYFLVVVAVLRLIYVAYHFTRAKWYTTYIEVLRIIGNLLMKVQ